MGKWLYFYTIKKTTMKTINVLNQISEQLKKDYKITEAFIYNNELYITSIWQITFETFAELEQKFINA